MNYFNFSKMAIVEIILFFIAALCVMFNFLTAYLIIPAFLCLSAGFLLVAIDKVKKYNESKKDFAYNQEEIIMELASTEDGDKYIAEKGSFAKRLKKQLKSEKWNHMLPIIVFFALSVIFLGLMINFVIGLF